MAPESFVTGVLGSLHSGLLHRLGFLRRYLDTMKIGGGSDYTRNKGRHLPSPRRTGLERDHARAGGLAKNDGGSSKRKLGLRMYPGVMGSERRRSGGYGPKKGSLLCSHDKSKSRPLCLRSPKLGADREKKGNIKSKKRNNRKETHSDRGVSQPPPQAPKPSHSTIPIQQFWAYASQYFRPITEDDLKYLTEERAPVLPYIIPLLGKHFTQQWREGGGQPVTHGGKSPPPAPDAEFSYIEHSDGVVHPGNVELKPLSERVLSSLVQEYVVNNPQAGEPPPERAPPPQKLRSAEPGSGLSLADLEERLKFELKHIGLIDADDPDDPDGGDILDELKDLQAQLKSQVAANNACRKKLREVALRWMAKQELEILISTNDKNIEKSYLRRFKCQRSKTKRKVTTCDYYPSSDAVAGYLKNREQLVKEIDSIFLPESLIIH